jgi:predicted esterase
MCNTRFSADQVILTGARVGRLYAVVCALIFMCFSTALASARADDTRSARDRAESAARQGDFKTAAQWYELWTSALPSDTTAYYKWAIALLRSGNAAKAGEVLKIGVQRGCADVTFLESESDFAILRALKEWPETLRRARSNAANTAEFPSFLCTQQRFGRYKVLLSGAGAPRYHPVLLLHGNGQTPDVVLRWAKGLNLPNVAFVCPEAPYVKVRESLHDNTLKLSAAPDDISAPPELRATVMEESAAWYFSAMNDAMRRLPLINEKPIVMGFSQGGFYASIVATRYADSVRSLVLLCSSIYPEAALETHARSMQLHGVDVFHAHGRRDATVSFSVAERIESILESNNVSHTFMPFDGEHWMTAEVDDAVRRWLRERFSISGQ